MTEEEAQQSIITTTEEPETTTETPQKSAEKGTHIFHFDMTMCQVCCITSRVHCCTWRRWRDYCLANGSHLRFDQQNQIDHKIRD